jgi:hypothetical protein
MGERTGVAGFKLKRDSWLHELNRMTISTIQGRTLSFKQLFAQLLFIIGDNVILDCFVTGTQQYVFEWVWMSKIPKATFCTVSKEDPDGEGNVTETGWSSSLHCKGAAKTMGSCKTASLIYGNIY